MAARACAWIAAAALTASAVLAQTPAVAEGGAVNGASFLPSWAPGGAAAPGSIVAVFGEALAAEPVAAEALPPAPELGGVRVEIVASDGRTLIAPPLFVSPFQINALAPAELPVGEYRLRVVRGGVAVGSTRLKVVRASFGLFFRDERGIPVAAAQVAEPSGLRTVTLDRPARPGDTISLWGTGLGASPAAATVEVYVAGSAVRHAFADRSPCCAGVDQINLQLPRDTPLGCVVPVHVVVDGNVSNFAALPVSADGGPCERGDGPARVTLLRQWEGERPSDLVSARFDGVPDRLDPARLPPAGACMVWPAVPAVPAPPTPDAGATIAIDGPAGRVELPRAADYVHGSVAQPFLGPGDYRLDGPGGVDVPAFTGALRVGPAPVPTALAASRTGVVAGWFGGAPGAAAYVRIGPRTAPLLLCAADLAAGRFAAAEHAIANLPAGAGLLAFGSQQAAPLPFEFGLALYRDEHTRPLALDFPRLAATPVRLPSGATILAEVASSIPERSRGLMFRESLAADRGMLFLFEADGVHGFWMLNTLVPLDIVWMDADRRVVFISAQTPPCRTAFCPTYGPAMPTRFVLEMAAGEAARRRLRPGDRLEW